MSLLNDSYFAVRNSGKWLACPAGSLGEQQYQDSALGAKSRVVAGHVSNRSRLAGARPCFYQFVTSTQIGTEVLV